MGVYNDPGAIRLASFGLVAEKTAAVAATGAKADLFSIEGGAVWLLDLFGIVETALPANTDLDLDFDPDDGGSDVVMASTLVADSDVTGTIYTINTTFGGALIASLDMVAVGLFSGNGAILVADSGDINLASSGGGAGGGSIHWYARWLPIELGAVLVASP